jgi:hypothetical protein
MRQGKIPDIFIFSVFTFLEILRVHRVLCGVLFFKIGLPPHIYGYNFPDFILTNLKEPP